MPAEPLSAPAGKTAELTCTYSTSVTDSFALEWSFVQPGKPISASTPVSWGWGWRPGGGSGLCLGKPSNWEPTQAEGREGALGDQCVWMRKEVDSL